MFSSRLDRHFYTMSITLNYTHHSVLVIVRRKKFYIQVSLQNQNGDKEVRKGLLTAGNPLRTKPKIIVK